MTSRLVAGIDPGTARIGYALLRGTPLSVELLTAETIVVPGARTQAARLSRLANVLTHRLRRDTPDVVALEKLYFSKNAKTALAVAEARGIILLTAHTLAPSIVEYAPLTVKLAVTGYGRADKSSMHRAVRAILSSHRVSTKPSLAGGLANLGDDAVDAIAIALTAIVLNRPRRG